MHNTKIIACLAAGLVCITACKKDSEDPPATPTPAPTTGTIKIGLGFHWGAPDFELGATYMDGAGHAIQIDALKFYLSEMHLENGGNIIADFHDSFILADAAEEASYTVGTAAPGSFDHVEIVIGLDSSTNHADPTLAEAPLNDPNMHWSWNPAVGYKFLLLEGRVDDDGDGVVDAGDPGFTYHCATDDALRVAAAAHSATITAGGTTSMHVHLHVNELVDGVDMLTTPMAMGYEAVNIQLMDNLATALEIE
ncbi:MAG TPA: MbnP family protein [Flavobacteriales bacterium]|nr:MbnP family protein [Flavobacteriales bacterium]